MNLPADALDVSSVSEVDEQVESLQRRIDVLEAELAEAKKLIETQGKRINNDLAMKMAIAKLLG
jgi:peptidoglycan hydrolase CwlO-like protein